MTERLGKTRSLRLSGVLSGRNGPARPSAAGRSRPPDSLPSLPGPTRIELLGRATAILFCVSAYTLYMPVTALFVDGHRRSSSLSFARISRSVCRASPLLKEERQLIEKQALQLSIFRVIFHQRFTGMTEQSILSSTPVGGSRVTAAPTSMSSQDVQGLMTFAQLELGAAFLEELRKFFT